MPAAPTALRPIPKIRYHVAPCAGEATLNGRRKMNAGEIENLIKSAMPGAQVRVLGDDGRHFEAIVVSAEFAGRTRVQQHRLVYQALGGRMESEEIHALALSTYTPDAWQAKNATS